MPTNLYGPGDNYDLNASHVLPALIRKVDTAKRSGGEMVIWGTGRPRREFLYVEDCADACVHLMKVYSDDMHVNIGSGNDISIAVLTRLVMRVLEHDGPIAYDLTKPDGTPRNLIDVSRLAALEWRASRLCPPASRLATTTISGVDLEGRKAARLRVMRTGYRSDGAGPSSVAA